jgi:predicted acetyltransferase
MELDIALASLEEKHILRHLLELYQYDFSPYDGADLDAFGLYGYKYLDHYWTDADRYPFLIQIDGRLAGFALVRRSTYFPELADPTGELPYTMAEFFILRKYRRRGAGQKAARFLFDRFPGRWEVAEIPENQEAVHFWRTVISAYTAGNFTEHWLDTPLWTGPVQVFHSPPAPR